MTLVCPTCGGVLYMERDSVIRCHGCPSAFRLVEQAAAPKPQPEPAPARTPVEREAGGRDSVADEETEHRAAIQALDEACRKPREDGASRSLRDVLATGPDARIDAMRILREHLLGPRFNASLAGRLLDETISGGPG